MKALDHFGRINFRFKPADKIEDEVYSERLNAIIEAINMNCLVSMSGGTFKKQPEGMSQSIRVRNTSGGGEIEAFPFQVVINSAADREVKIRPANVGIRTPTINGLPLIADLENAPILTLAEDTRCIYYEGRASFNTTFSAWLLDSVVIGFGPDVDPPVSSSPANFFRKIAGVVIVDNEINTVFNTVRTSHDVQYCGFQWLVSTA